MNREWLKAAAACGMVMGALCASLAQATLIDIGTPTLFSFSPICGNANQYQYCTNNAFIDDATVSFADARFNDLYQKSFDAWNAGNAAGSKWTLANGGALGGTLVVRGAINGTTGATLGQAHTQNFQNVGGFEISIKSADNAGLNLNNFVWSQGLFDNYDGGIVPPMYEMDVKNPVSGTAPETGVQPLYPFQYQNMTMAGFNGLFYDFPAAPWPNGFFEAIAMISTADFTSRTLTVYEGVEYGFKLNVPEPGTLLLLCLAMAMATVMMRRTTLR